MAGSSHPSRVSSPSVPITRKANKLAMEKQKGDEEGVVEMEKPGETRKENKLATEKQKGNQQIATERGLATENR